MIKIGHRRLISAFSVLNPFFHTLEKPTLWSKIHLTGRSDGFSMLVLGPLEYAESESVFIFWLSGAKVQIFAF